MKSFIAFFGLIAVAVASPQFYAGAYAPTITQQYHAQDELGQYTYGYSGGPSAKEETRTADGITRGSYSYIDGHGLVQSASYVSDPINGFRVAATNLPVGPSGEVAAAPSLVAPIAVAAPAIVAAAPAPVAPLDTPEVIAARALHFAAHNEAIARLGRKRRSVALAAPLAYAAPLNRFAYTTVSAHAPLTVAAHAYAAPAPLAYSAHVAAPLAYSAPIAAPIAIPAVTKTQYHAQDELGQYSYGYSDGLSSKQESKTADGITTGAYSYLDSNGIVQKVNYVADAAGFRVAATNLPVGPA